MDKACFMGTRSKVGILFACLMMLGVLAASAVPWPVAMSADGGTVYSRTITVNSGQVPSAQTDFPLLISVSDSTLRDSGHGGHVAGSGGADIYFTNSTGTVQYPYEIEMYDASAGTLIAWVKVPSLTDGTAVKMSYGGSGGAANTPSNVWTNGFQGVWHMAQVNPLDSTSNGNNGTVTAGSVSSSSGQMDGADAFVNSPASGYVDCGTGSSLNFSASGTYTWTAWFNTTGAPGGGCGVIGKATPGTGGSGYDVYLKNGNGVVIQAGSGGSGASQVASTTVPTSNAWHQIAVTYNNQAVSIYLDGALDNSGLLSAMADDSSAHVFLGYRASHTNGTGVFNGTLDEIKSSNVVRSADWITAEYRNQGNPGAFYTVSAEESSSTQVAPTAAFTADVMSGPSPLTVNFTDQSTGTPTGWAWDFDNNGSTDSTAQNPANTYSTPGVYSVKLTASNALGSDDELKMGYINVAPATFTITASAGANGQIDPAGPVTVSYGADQSFTIGAATGYRVADVMVDSASVGAVTNYTFTSVKANHTIAASFAANSTAPNWDLNSDHVCNILDVVLLGLKWSQTGAHGWIPEDLNSDGVINIGDVVVLGLHWGATW